VKDAIELRQATAANDMLHSWTGVDRGVSWADSGRADDRLEKDWQHSFWWPNYERLLKVKAKYDPDGLFFVHHGVGSEDWSDDGFIRLR
jgi:FAD/FMN-containing dehydrogenase